MLRTNLATRPFYDERAVNVGLAVVGVVALAVLAVGVGRAADVARSREALISTAEEREREAGQLAGRASTVRQAFEAEEVESISDAAAEASRLVEQRTFSWTEFFNFVDRTLPTGVMLTAIRPGHAEHGVTVAMNVIGRRVADIDEFIERLEETGAFADVLAREEEMLDGGTYRARLSGRYRPTDEPAGADAMERVP